MPESYLTIMTEEVIVQMRKNSFPLRKAFAHIAHRHNIFFTTNKEQYSYHLRKIRQRIARLPDYNAKNQTLPKIAPIAPANQPPRQKALDFKQRAAHDVC